MSNLYYQRGVKRSGMHSGLYPASKFTRFESMAGYRSRIPIRPGSYRRQSNRPKATLAKKVMAIVRKNEPVKNQVYSTIIPLTNYATATPTFIPLCPNSTTLTVAQGSGEGDRIGDKIKTHKAIFKGTFYPNGYDMTYNPVPIPYRVRMLILKNKQSPTATPVLATLFQSGDSSTSPTGNIQDLYQPINQDTCVVYHDSLHKVGFSDYTGTGFVVAAQDYANNDFALNVDVSLDVTKHLPAHIQFNDGTATPTSANIYVLFICASMDGGSSTGNARPIFLAYNTYFEFTDM